MTNYYDDRATKATTSTILLLPTIGKNRRRLLKYGFLNAYLDDKDYDIHYEEALYLLFKPEPSEKISELVSFERQDSLFLDEYDYEGGYVVVVYAMQKKYLPEYKLFLEGKYSKFSQEYKDSFAKMLDVRNKETGIVEKKISLQYHIMNRTDTLKDMREKEFNIKMAEFGPDMEYWSIPDIHGKETLNILKIKEYGETIRDIEI